MHTHTHTSRTSHARMCVCVFAVLVCCSAPQLLLPLHFQTLTMPSLDEVTMKPWVVWKVAMSVMMSWCPTGRDSGPRRGEFSATPLFCLLWISCTTSVPSMIFLL